MKKVCIVLVLLAATLIPDADVTAQGHRVMTATIETESGRKTVEIRYFAESEEWAKNVFKTIREGFPLLEERIGVPCPTAYDIVVEETTSLKAGVGGMNKGPLGLVVPTGTSTHVIIHELCHYWFGWMPDLHWSNWILEGFPEAYTISLLQELDHPEGYDHWYGRLHEYQWAKAELGGDKPLSEVGYTPDFEDPRVGMLYSKATVFCSWLLLYFSEEEMHKINEQILFMNPLRTEDYQEIAEEVTGEDLDWLFSGWVYSGEYYYEGNPVSFEWFAGDGDSDGISTLKEIENGSSPFVTDTDRDGLPDGYEPLLKTDVTNADTDADGLTDGEEVPIIIDGKNTEWKTPLIDDEKDSESPVPPDVKAVYYAADDKYVYFMVECYNNPNMAHQTGILIDTNNDRSAEYGFFVSYDYLFLGMWEEDQYTEVFDPASLKGTFLVVDDVIEFRIPKRMGKIQFPNHIRVWALEFYTAEGETTDKTYSEFISLGKNVESTNPLNPDSDGDGLKDGEDANPLSADVTEQEESTEVETGAEMQEQLREEAETLFDEGTALFEEGEYEQAKEKFEEALAAFTELGDEERVEECKEQIFSCKEALEPSEDGGTCFGTFLLALVVGFALACKKCT